MPAVREIAHVEIIHVLDETWYVLVCETMQKGIVK